MSYHLVYYMTLENIPLSLLASSSTISGELVVPQRSPFFFLRFVVALILTFLGVLQSTLLALDIFFGPGLVDLTILSHDSFDIVSQFLFGSDLHTPISKNNDVFKYSDKFRLNTGKTHYLEYWSSVSHWVGIQSYTDTVP